MTQQDLEIERQRRLRAAQRVVIKLGTSVVTGTGGEICADRIEPLVRSIAALKKASRQVVLVSSGAVGLGAARLGLHQSRLKDVVVRQACAAVGGQNVALACDLSNPASVHACVTAIIATGVQLDAIICNAGIMGLPKLELAHGYELQFFTNHVGHFILVNGLLEQLSATGRVVMVSSAAHNQAPKGGIEFDNLDGSKGYGAWRQYGQSKFANILFAKELARRFVGTQRTANAVHPGIIKTNLARHNLGARVFYEPLAHSGADAIGQAAKRSWLKNRPGQS